MTLDKLTWLVVLLLVLGAAGAHRWRGNDASASEKDVEKVQPLKPGAKEPPSISWERLEDRVSDQAGEGEQETTRQAIRQAVLRVRAEQAGERPAEIHGGDSAFESARIEMTWDQYRAWTKLAAGLAQRDYQAVEAMLPEMESLFGPAMVEAMVDAAVEDYSSYLVSIQESRCEDWDAQSVWRKTMFMSFSLARLNRSTAAMESRASEVRQLCGYAG